MIRKNLDLIIVGFLTLAVVMYDVTLELFGELMHFLFEVLHTAFEYVELGIEEAVELVFHVLDVGEIIEYLFESDRHGSQVVTFYILLAIGWFIVSKTWRLAKRSYQSFVQWWVNAWVRRKTELHWYWVSLTLQNKLALGATVIIVAYLASFFVI